ncbi:MAG: ATP-binding protein [Terracidiphilus sp.]|jgi:anti-sigma regulatory factor (Ser/Thr protein kinase)
MLVARAESLGPATAFVSKGAREANLPESRVHELELLIEEILMNVSRYSYPEGAPGVVTITYSVPAPGEFAVEVGDQGVAFDPLAASPPDLTLDLMQRPIGGLGILLLKSFAKLVTYRREQGWNRLIFTISASS